LGDFDAEENENAIVKTNEYRASPLTYIQVNLQLGICLWSRNCSASAIMDPGFLCDITMSFCINSSLPVEKESKFLIKSNNCQGLKRRSKIATFGPFHPSTLRPFLCLEDSEVGLTVHRHKAVW